MFSFINPGLCQALDSENLLKELKTYKFQKDKEGVETNKPVDYNNHACDALRYAITTFSRGQLVQLL